MIEILQKNGEIPLLIGQEDKHIPTDKHDEWFLDMIFYQNIGLKPAPVDYCLSQLDQILYNWYNKLTQEQRKKIKTNRTLYGIPHSKEREIYWRNVVRNSDLRDISKSHRDGRSVGTYNHVWHLDVNDFLDKHLTKIEKDLIAFIDLDYPREEIGLFLLEKYGEEFWKKRKENSTNTASSVVNNYLSHRIPRRLTKIELLDFALKASKTTE